MLLDLRPVSPSGRSLAPPISQSCGDPSQVPASADPAGPSFRVRDNRDALIARHTHLVKYVVGRLRVSIDGVFDSEDAMQAGTLGLLGAIGAYKPDSDASFESYAIVRIRGSILDAVRALDPVGRGGREFARAIGVAIGMLQVELDRVPTASEIAERLGIPVGRYHERLRGARVITVSLDRLDGREDGEDHAGFGHEAVDLAAIDPEAEATRRDDLVRLACEIGRLSSRQQAVVSMYYRDELTFREIGSVLGLTESRICQIHTGLVLALRTRMVDADIAARLPRRLATSRSRVASMAPITMLRPREPTRLLHLSRAFRLRDEVPPAA